MLSNTILDLFLALITRMMCYVLVSPKQVQGIYLVDYGIEYWRRGELGNGAIIARNLGEVKLECGSPSDSRALVHVFHGSEGLARRINRRHEPARGLRS